MTPASREGRRAIAVLMLLLVAGVAAAAEPTAEERVGEEVFQHGVGEDGREITAAIGDGGAKVPASSLPCAGCHAKDGHGSDVGGELVPPDVRWSRLASVDPAYTERLVKRAVTMGITADGRELNTAMPRYQLTLGEAAGLVAYLKRLDTAPPVQREPAPPPRPPDAGTTP